MKLSLSSIRAVVSNLIPENYTTTMRQVGLKTRLSECGTRCEIVFGNDWKMDDFVHPSPSGIPLSLNTAFANWRMNDSMMFDIGVKILINLVGLIDEMNIGKYTAMCALRSYAYYVRRWLIDDADVMSHLGRVEIAIAKLVFEIYDSRDTNWGVDSGALLYIEHQTIKHIVMYIPIYGVSLPMFDEFMKDGVHTQTGSIGYYIVVEEIMNDGLGDVYDSDLEQYLYLEDQRRWIYQEFVEDNDVYTVHNIGDFLEDAMTRSETG